MSGGEKESERAAIVVWLRKRERACADIQERRLDLGLGEDDEMSLRWAVYGDSADAIERGEHLTSKGGE